MLQLISSGVVFTLRPGRGQPTIRDTSQRSHGVAWGQLGRKIDSAVKKVQLEGWARPDEAYSQINGGGSGLRWQLTEAGTTALKG
ncbi:hypothetical protein ABZ468_50205 [Streptomyces sp. NPDC005708]|uniref:hypothetical protein n=1 Tax=Streptomyces sp. NPDC005708 TaxID=3154564 RepID=UPI0033D9C917